MNKKTAMMRMSLTAMAAMMLACALVVMVNSTDSPTLRGVNTTAPPPDPPTPTVPCPQATSEPFWVDPVTSPTEQFTQVIQVYLGLCEAVTVTAESGVFSAADPCGDVTMALLPNVVHHLQVAYKVPLVEYGGCSYGGYTLSTNRDRFGAPLVIAQQFTVASVIRFPLILRTYSSPTLYAR